MKDVSDFSREFWLEPMKYYTHDIYIYTKTDVSRRTTNWGQQNWRKKKGPRGIRLEKLNFHDLAIVVWRTTAAIYQWSGIFIFVLVSMKTLIYFIW